MLRQATLYGKIKKVFRPFRREKGSAAEGNAAAGTAVYSAFSRKRGSGIFKRYLN